MELKIFRHPAYGWRLRTKSINGEIWFIASDAAKALGYEKPNNAIQKHCRKATKISYPETGQPINIVPESDLYRLIFRSKLKEAENFQDWVCENVLPEIRKTGKYDLSQETQIPKTFAESLQLAANQAKEIEQLEEQKKLDAPKVAFSEKIQGTDDNISMAEMAKLSGKIGRNGLFEILRRKGVLQHNNVYYQKYDMYFKLSENVIKNGTEIKQVTLVRPKGQMWILRKLDEWLRLKTIRNNK